MKKLIGLTALLLAPLSLYANVGDDGQRAGVNSGEYELVESSGNRHCPTSIKIIDNEEFIEASVPAGLGEIDGRFFKFSKTDNGCKKKATGLLNLMGEWNVCENVTQTKATRSKSGIDVFSGGHIKTTDYIQINKKNYNEINIGNDTRIIPVDLFGDGDFAEFNCKYQKLQ